MENENTESQPNQTPKLSAEEREQQLEWELHEWVELILDFYEKYGPHMEGLDDLVE